MKCVSGVSAFLASRYLRCSIRASGLSESIHVASLQIMSSHARFEYAMISWSSMEGLRTQEEWHTWSENKHWLDLPRGQEMRHRCMDGQIYMGNGSVSYLYTYIPRENVEIMSGWSLCFGCVMSLKPNIQGRRFGVYVHLISIYLSWDAKNQ